MTNSYLLNGLTTPWQESLTLEDLISAYEGIPDLHFINGSPGSLEQSILPGDEVVLIEKGAPIQAATLEAMMIARHSPGVHKKLKTATVLIAGLGGLGSNVAVALARIGVGHLRLIDFDVVEPSNLNRQAYRIKDLGHKKCHALANILREINPYLTYEAIDLKLSEWNLDQHLTNISLVVEAFDSPEAKAMIVTHVLSKTDLNIVSASGMAGLHDPNQIKSQKLMNRLYLTGDGLHEAGPMEGLMSPRVLIAAGHQATVACRLLLNLPTPDTF